MVTLASPVSDMSEYMADIFWGTRTTEGENLLEFAVSCNLLIGNTCFKKWTNHLITYTLGTGRTQIDYKLFRKTFHKHVRDVKVIPGEEIAKEHHVLDVISVLTSLPHLRRNSSLA